MKIGVIGAGNMASAIIGGIIGSGLAQPQELYASDLDEGKLAVFAAQGVHTYSGNEDVFANSEVIIVAVKPDIYPKVLSQVASVAHAADKLYISIAPGISIAAIKAMLGFDGKVIRTMPNTPALVGEGMTILCSAAPVTKTDEEVACGIFNAVGKTSLLPEKMMDAVVALNGSSPAYVFMFIEAMADGAVLNGIPRSEAYKIAAQSVLGSAKMVLETGLHPAHLKDMVCSPGGTTIEAVRVLEDKGLRSAIIEAMDACTQKTVALGKANKSAPAKESALSHK